MSRAGRERGVVSSRSHPPAGRAAHSGVPLQHDERHPAALLLARRQRPSWSRSAAVGGARLARRACSPRRSRRTPACPSLRLERRPVDDRAGSTAGLSFASASRQRANSRRHLLRAGGPDEVRVLLGEPDGELAVRARGSRRARVGVGVGAGGGGRRRRRRRRRRCGRAARRRSRRGRSRRAPAARRRGEQAKRIQAGSYPPGRGPTRRRRLLPPPPRGRRSRSRRPRSRSGCRP